MLFCGSAMTFLSLHLFFPTDMILNLSYIIFFHHQPNFYYKRKRLLRLRIKHLRNEKGLFIDKISKTLNINWRTAKKYVDECELSPSIIKPRKGLMYNSLCACATKNNQQFTPLYKKLIEVR